MAHQCSILPTQYWFEYRPDYAGYCTINYIEWIEILLDLRDILVIVVEDHKAFHYSADLLHIKSTVLHTKAMVQCNMDKWKQYRWDEIKMN